VGSWLAGLVDIAILFDALTVMSAFMATTSRGWFALARHKLLPSGIASISSRFHTPLGGNILVAIVVMLVLALVAISQRNIATAAVPAYVLTVFGIMSAAGSLLIELIYIGLCIAAVRLLLDDPEQWWRWLFLAMALVTPLLGIYGSIIPFPSWPQSLAIYITVSVIVLSAVWTLVIRFAFPKRLGTTSDGHPWDEK
jgi:amino acid transporter